MTNDDSHFLGKIFGNPEDHTPRLVYADWLDETGRPAKAEFVRKSHDYHHGQMSNKERNDLRTRLMALADDPNVLPRAYHTLGVSHFWNGEPGPTWDGGFLSRVTVGPHFIAPTRDFRPNQLNTFRRIRRLARLQPLVRELFVTHGLSMPLFDTLDVLTRIWPHVEKLSIWRTESYLGSVVLPFPYRTWAHGVDMLARWPRLRLVQSSISHIQRIRLRLNRPEVTLKVRIY